MEYKVKNRHHLNISEKYYYKKDNSVVSIRKFYFDHLKRTNEVSYLILHHNTGIEFNVHEYQISKSESKVIDNTPFRELDFVYHINSNLKGQPKCYEIISITEDESGYVNHYCKELYTQNFENFSQNQLSYLADKVYRNEEDNLWR